MAFNIGDRVRITSLRLSAGELYGELGHVVRDDGFVWPYGVVMDKADLNVSSGFIWVGDDEIAPELPTATANTALGRPFGDALRKLEIAENTAQEERDRADSYRDAYLSLKNSDDSDDDVQEQSRFIADLKESLATVCLELLSVSADYDDLKAKFDAISEQNEELSATLAQEKARNSHAR